MRFEMALELYEGALHAARKRFFASSGPQAICSGSTSPLELEGFLIHYCALGPWMTGPVESWIRRAGLRCLELGLQELGAGLVEHAHEEASHDLLIHADAIRLVERWNRRISVQLDAAQLSAEPLPKPVERYRALHEDVIAGEHPYGQLAIEYEIEALALPLAVPLLALAARSIGEQTARSLTFLKLHAEIDGGHTACNAAHLERFLRSYPAALEPLVAAGSAVLDIYAEHLTHCWLAGRELAARVG
jgi:hypothetical protein